VPDKPTPPVFPPADAPEAQPDDGADGQEATPSADAGLATARKQRRAKSRQRALVEWVLAITLAITAAFVIKTWFVQAFVIPSGSMEPTLQVNDRVLVAKFAYRISDIHRGDVVVFKNPARLPDEPAQLIKRVVGVGGDVIQTVDGKLVVNGALVPEPYLAPGTMTRAPDGHDLPKTTVAAGHIFVMGDNRGNSRDSRYIGPIENKTVVGKAFFRLWPVRRIGRL
jgi:signal peptidase I